MSLTMRPLSDTRVRILRRLAHGELRHRCPETAREIAVALDMKNAGPVIALLADEGLVKRLGVGDRNASTWTITAEGREALARPVPVPSGEME